jgi:cyclin A
MPNICKKDLQLLGIACLFLASKFEEIMVPHIDDLVYVAAKTFTREDVVKMEKEVAYIKHRNKLKNTH